MQEVLTSCAIALSGVVRMMNMQKQCRVFAALSLVLFVVISCTSQEKEQQPDTQRAMNKQQSLSTSISSLSRFQTLNIVTGQTLFIPAYKEFFIGRVRVVNLQTTVSIFNTDTDAAIIIKSARYYDTDGQLVKEYIEDPLAACSRCLDGIQC